MKTRKYSGLKPTRKDYCQFIIAALMNYTQTYMADHHIGFSHDAINRYLMEDDVSPNAAWQSVGHLVRRSGNACLIFDDSVLDKRHSFKIELVRRQYSGNGHGVVKGIGVANCVYANLDTGEHWIIDWRIYDPDGDGKTKLDHVRDMFDDAIQGKNLPFRAALMDSWYATKDLMMHIDRAGKVFYCPLKANRKADDSRGKTPCKAVSDLEWFGDEMLRGKLVKIHGFPKRIACLATKTGKASLPPRGARSNSASWATTCCNCWTSTSLSPRSQPRLTRPPRQARRPSDARDHPKRPGAKSRTHAG